MNENDKAQVRNFISTQAGKLWLEEALGEYPHMNAAEAKDIHLLNASLQYNEGWRGCIAHLTAKVRRQEVQDFGVQPIDTVRD